MKITIAKRPKPGTNENKVICRIIISRRANPKVRVKSPIYINPSVCAGKDIEVDKILEEKDIKVGEILEKITSQSEVLTEDAETSESANEATEEEDATELEEPVIETPLEEISPEEQKQEFLEFINAKNQESLEKHEFLETFCEDLGIHDKVLRSGIYYSNRSKDEKSFYRNVASDFKGKNPAGAKIEMTKAFTKWFETYQDTPKDFKVTLQEFLNVFRTSMKKF